MQKNTGIFEISHNNDLVTTGRVRMPSNEMSEKVFIKLPTENDPNTMDKMDFYKFALSKSYNYKGLFRSIVRINLEGTNKFFAWKHSHNFIFSIYKFAISHKGTQSRVSWTRNWVTYLDGMLQMTILHDPTDAKHVPVEIEKIVIDVDKHAKIVESNGSGECSTHILSTL